MLFTCKPINGMTVIIEPGKTIFQGPYDKQNVMGVDVKFVGGFYEIDATWPLNLDVVKKLIKHPGFGSDFRYFKTPIKVMVGGRSAMMDGYELDEAIKVAEEACAARLAGEPAPPPPAPAGDGLSTDMLAFDSPLASVGVPITTGTLSSKNMQPKASELPGVARKGPPGSKFVKQVAVPEPVTVSQG